jgi:CYTH domain-containing protein
MSITRRFLLAPSLARLLEKERGGRRVTEGYFPDRHDRNTYVRVEEGRGTLILVTHGTREGVEVPADIPLIQAEALVDLAAGGIDYRRVDLGLGTGTASVSRIMAPGELDLIAVGFEQEEQARAFQPPAWFGPEVTADPSYRSRSLAIAGLPSVPEVELTDGALDSLLDTLENGSPSSQLLVEPSAHVIPPLPTNGEEDAEDLDIEDSVIRELAHSLRPKQR